jgi:hypothetical protein
VKGKVTFYPSPFCLPLIFAAGVRARKFATIAIFDCMRYSVFLLTRGLSPLSVLRLNEKRYIFE